MRRGMKKRLLLFAGAVQVRASTARQWQGGMIRYIYRTCA